MTKLLQNKTLIKFLGIALSILLIVALIPQIGIAYGSKDDVVGETPMAETGEGDEATDEGEEAAADGDEAATPEEGTEPGEGEDAVEGEVSVIDGVEMVSHKVEVPGEEDEDTTENAIAPQSSEDEGGDTVDDQETIKKSEALVGNSDREIKANEEITNTSSPLTFSGNKTCTLTVNGTLKSDILITGGAKATIAVSGTLNGDILITDGAQATITVGGTLNGGIHITGGSRATITVNKTLNGGIHITGGSRATITVNKTLNGDILITGGAKVTINGSGTIEGTHTSSVITVEGKGSNLIFGEIKDGVSSGPTVTGGTGRPIPNKNKWVVWNEVGGGIHVCRAKGNNEEKNASLEFRGGTVSGNTAEAGGGIFIDYRCGFTMSGGSVLNNTATKHEGGGIFTWGNWNGKTGDESQDYGHITAATIKENKTLTTTDWGGGGIYINNDGVLKIESARITKNTAESLGGGVAGCPHAEIGIGKMENGAAVYDNIVEGKNGPVNSGLKFNMPKSFSSEGMYVPSGDFLVQGLDKSEVPILAKDDSAKSVSYKPSDSPTTYYLSPGNYAKDEFDPALAQDFYCTYASFVAATNLKSHSKTNSKDETVAWEGFIAEVAASKVQGNTVTEKSSPEEQNWSASRIEIPVNTEYEIHDATLCLRSTASADNSGIDRTVIIEENTSKTHGGGVACNGTLQFGDFPQKDEIVNNYTLSLDKEVVSGITDETLSMQKSDTFEFVLIDNDDPKKKYETTSTIVNGKGKIDFTDLPGVKTSTPAESPKTFTLYENLTEDQKASGFEPTIPEDGVQITVDLSVKSSSVTYDNMTTTTYTTTAQDIKIGGQKTKTVTNRYAPHGKWQFRVDKYFYGLGDPRDCSFTMQEIERAPQAGEPLTNVLVANDNLQKWTANASVAAFQKNKAAVVFDPIKYQVTAPKDAEADQNIPTAGDARGDHYYLITENGDDAAKDTTAYVIKVNVALDDDNPRNLKVTEEVRGYADDLNSVLNPMPEGESPAFYNTDTQHMISAASYSVYAASGEPVDQVCYVDPKIIKNLEGRAIKSGEFAFKLIEVANYNDTEGTVISATTNDEFGMVDFDKANNVSGNLENPSCLAYTKPGTYYYRVIEDTTKGGMNDQSVLYSDQVITFTTVIKQDEATGRLVCTDMYYGYWDKAANKNVRYDEQYTDFDTQPTNIGDMSKLNPDWHPTITNKTRPMDIQVRKTSVTDRTEGLVGATYALYMVNENAQGDIKLAEATSEDGGWITYKKVSLSTNNLYYFKETAAPAGHTVSEFRSSYFYLVEDASSANGYALQYTDTKFLAEASAAAEPQAVALADETDAQAAAEAANKAAGNTETQPGHSADGNVLLTYDKDGGVYDEATQVEVNKLDTRTHEWVEGAKLVILEKESGKEVASWTSGKGPQKLEKTLNVGTTYLLREVEAPNQYRLANDVEFVIDDYGNVSITKGTENGNAELSDNSITLYDTMMDAEEVETVEREKSTTEKPKKDTLLAKTGDMLPILGIALVALAALIVVIVAMRRRRAGEDETTQS